MAKYIGAGKAIVGVPARDLTAEEWKAYKETILAAQAASHEQLYVPEIGKSEKTKE